MDDARSDAILLARTDNHPALFGVLFDQHFTAHSVRAELLEALAWLRQDDRDVLVLIAWEELSLLVDAPGWRVSRADEFGVGYGEMTFSDGERLLDLHWRRGADFGGEAR